MLTKPTRGSSNTHFSRRQTLLPPLIRQSPVDAVAPINSRQSTPVSHSRTPRRSTHITSGASNAHLSRRPISPPPTRRPSQIPKATRDLYTTLFSPRTTVSQVKRPQTPPPNSTRPCTKHIVLKPALPPIKRGPPPLPKQKRNTSTPHLSVRQTPLQHPHQLPKHTSGPSKLHIRLKPELPPIIRCPPPLPKPTRGASNRHFSRRPTPPPPSLRHSPISSRQSTSVSRSRTLRRSALIDAAINSGSRLPIQSVSHSGSRVSHSRTPRRFAPIDAAILSGSRLPIPVARQRSALLRVELW